MPMPAPARRRRTNPYVFTFEDGRQPHPDTIRQRFDRLLRLLGFRGSHSMICGTPTRLAR